jgi:ubiquinone/menaquinone biosynthesis C-methylase UbiE
MNSRSGGSSGTATESQRARWSAYRAVRIPHDRQRSRAWKHIVRYLERYAPRPAGRVLDLAAGYCDFINNVRADERVAMDANPDFAQFADTGVRFEVGDCTDLSRFGGATFDLVFASNFLEHLSRDDGLRVLREIHRVLRPEGRLLLLQPNYRLRPSEYFDDYTHVSVFSDRSLPDLLLSEGYRVITVRGRFLPLTFKSRASALTFLVPLYLRSPVKPLAGHMLVVAARAAEHVA